MFYCFDVIVFLDFSYYYFLNPPTTSCTSCTRPSIFYSHIWQPITESNTQHHFYFDIRNLWKLFLKTTIICSDQNQSSSHGKNFLVYLKSYCEAQKNFNEKKRKRKEIIQCDCSQKYFPFF